jgi:hypothetical protein
MKRGFSVPDTKEVSRMLTFLLGREVKVAKGSRIRTGARDVYTLAVFVNEAKEPVGMCATDFGMAANVGAALSLFPPHKARQCVKDLDMEPELWENTLEVYNVVSRFFHDGHEGMVHLGPTFQSGDDVPRDIKRLMRRSKARVDLVVDIQGYGRGTMALIG